MTENDPIPHVDRDATVQVLRDAHAYYRQPRVLDPSWVPDYLNRRNLYQQLRYAGIGYAPAGWTNLLDHLRGRGHTDDALLAAGVARTASTGNLIDHFRDRLVVPVVDADRQLVGFVGRAADDAGPDTPKYLNSPATDLFDKGRLLYALGEDRADLASGALPILVEGPLDRLAVRQAAGNLAVVGLAPLGTAFTADQARLLAATIGPRRPVAVALDPDPAGRLAAIRAWDRLTEAGFTNLLHIALPEGRDPADLVRAGRARHLRHAIIHARPLALAVADHRISDVSSAGPLDWQKRYGILGHVLGQDLGRVPADRVGPYLAHLGRRLQLDHQTVTTAAFDHLTPRLQGATHSEDAVQGFTARVHAAEGFPSDSSSTRPPSPAGSRRVDPGYEAAARLEPGD